VHVRWHLEEDPGFAFIFGSLTVLFFLLAIRDITGSALIGTISGI
jgi:succinate-acetate transporter protein